MEQDGGKAGKECVCHGSSTLLWSLKPPLSVNERRNLLTPSASLEESGIVWVGLSAQQSSDWSADAHLSGSTPAFLPRQPCSLTLAEVTLRTR